MQVLSIQSSVSYGHVGNSAAVFPLQRLGHEVLPVHTVLFSNHTGYGAWRGPVVPGPDVHEVILGIEERGALAGTDLVLSGYQGSPQIAEVVVDAVERVKASNPGAAGPLRQRPPVSFPSISGKSRSSVGLAVTWSFSMNVYGTMSSDAAMPK